MTEIGADIPEWRHQYNLQFPLSTNNNIPRLIVDALLMPSISTMVGRILFSHITPKWQRTALVSSFLLVVYHIAYHIYLCGLFWYSFIGHELCTTRQCFLVNWGGG